MTEKQTLEEFISKIAENAKSDRELAESLLDNLCNEIEEYEGNDPEKNERAGVTAEKYLQAIQRANDQLIKAAKVLRKAKKDEQESGASPISSSNDLFDEIEEESGDEDEEVVLGDAEESG